MLRNTFRNTQADETPTSHDPASLGLIPGTMYSLYSRPVTLQLTSQSVTIIPERINVRQLVQVQLAAIIIVRLCHA